MTQEMTRRERRAAERKQKILDAAAQVFADKGYHRATTKEIAEVADIAEGTIYTYFNSKDDLLLGIIGSMAQLNVQQTLLHQSVDQDLEEFIRSYLMWRLQLTGPYQRLLIGIVPELLHHPQLRERYNTEFIQPALAMIEQHIRQRVERGQLGDIDAPLLTRILTGALFGFQMLVILGDPVSEGAWQHPERLVNALTTMILDGVRRS
jgi:AcrR family transcriptional regulator